MHLCSTLLLLAASAAALRPALPATQHRRRRGAVTMMGRKFENNKVKMAKTALAYAKKARALGPPMPRVRPRATVLACICRRVTSARRW